jgi:hypothetical protein
MSHSGKPPSDSTPRRGPITRLALTFALLSCSAADATTIVPMSIENLTRSSDAVVLATVESVASANRDDGRIETLVELAIAEVLKGAVGDDVITLHEPGGEVDGRAEIIYGAPHYSVGDLVTVFMRRTPRGWRTSHMLMGKFDVFANEGGALSATQEAGGGTTVLLRNGQTWPVSMPLLALKAEIAAASEEEAGSRIEVAPLPVIERETYEEFVLRDGLGLGNPRFFEPDTGRAVSFLFDSRGDDILGLATARQAVNDAFLAWSEVADASITLVDGGLTNDTGAPCPQQGEPGVHKVRFNDPDDEIDDPAGCSGVLARGGSCFNNSQTKIINGNLFAVSSRGVVTFADNWDGCEQWTPCNFAEVGAHEVGHAIGFGHSSENPNEGNAVLRDAIMYFRAQFDGRCADLREDDLAALVFVYPSDVPPTITSPSTLPFAVLREPYSFQFEATGGSGNFAWSLDCQFCDGLGLTLSQDGFFSGTPGSFSDTPLPFEVTAADSAGDSHTSRFDVTVFRTPPDVTPTPVPTATSPRTDTPTRTSAPDTPTNTPKPPTPTLPADRPCIGDCDEDGAVRIPELIRGVGIALGEQLLEVCPSFDRDGSGTVSVGELIAAVNAALGGCTGPA